MWFIPCQHPREKETDGILSGYSQREREQWQKTSSAIHDSIYQAQQLAIFPQTSSKDRAVKIMKNVKTMKLGWWEVNTNVSEEMQQFSWYSKLFWGKGEKQNKTNHTTHPPIFTITSKSRTLNIPTYLFCKFHYDSFCTFFKFIFGIFFLLL